MVPCELVSQNGRVLRDTVKALARDAEAPVDFVAWLQGDVIWADTLVDRIVSEAIEPIGAVAEPYALWAIERQPGLQPPCHHAAIVMADDLEPFERGEVDHRVGLAHAGLAHGGRARLGASPKILDAAGTFGPGSRHGGRRPW